MPTERIVNCVGKRCRSRKANVDLPPNSGFSGGSPRAGVLQGFGQRASSSAYGDEREHG